MVVQTREICVVFHITVLFVLYFINDVVENTYENITILSSSTHPVSFL